VANEDLVPQYLSEIFNRAVPDPLDDNSPFQSISAPIDGVTVADTVSGANAGPGPYLYGAALYGRATYGNHA